MYSYLRVPTCTVPVHVPTCTVCRSVGVVCWKLFCSKNTSDNVYEKCTHLPNHDATEAAKQKTREMEFV